MSHSRRRRHSSRPLLLSIIALALIVASCGGTETDSATTDDPSAAEAGVTASNGVSLVSATEAAEIVDDPPDDLVILDVRTPEEFAEGHIEGAILLDFYRDDFATELAELDPDVPYVLYCRSGNRSGKAATMMAELGFRQVSDVDGGVIAWEQAGLALTDA